MERRWTWPVTRERVKSQTTTRLSPLVTSRLADLRSRWMIFLACRKAMPWAASWAYCSRVESLILGMPAASRSLPHRCSNGGCSSKRQLHQGNGSHHGVQL